MKPSQKNTSQKKMNAQTREFSTTTGPSRILIVRHGDRMDHEDKTWRKSAERPHDSPLSDSGHISAHLLGRFLTHSRGLRVTEESLRNGDIVFLASPLQRTVETAHGMITGMLTESGLGHLILPSSPSSSSSISPLDKPYVKAAEAAAAIYADLASKGLPVGDKVLTESPSPTPSPLPAEGAGLVSIGDDAGGGSYNFSSTVMTAAVMGATLSSSWINGPFSAPSSSSTAEQQGATTSSARSSVPLIPIFLEPGVIEGQYWLNLDIACGVSQGNTVVHLEPAHTGNLPEHTSAQSVTTAVVTDTSSNGGLVADKGVFRTEDFHRAHVSPLVVSKRLTCPLLTNTASAPSTTKETAANEELLRFASPNTKGIAHGFSYLSMGFDPETKQIIEHGDGVGWRCRETIANIANSPALNGKIVIVVGHGETTMAMVKGLAYITKYSNPYYTSFTEAVRFTPAEVEEAKRIANVSREDRPIRGFNPEPWQRWKVREGTHAFDCPHLALASQSSVYDPVRKKKF